MKNISKVSFVIIGTMIGAGFASGQEIYAFFSIYGIKGILGIAISSILTGIIIYKVFKIMQENQIHNYNEFLQKISSNQKINKIIQIIVKIFLLISFYIMVAGFCAYFKQEFQIPILASAIIMAILCYITLSKNIQGVISINSILVPILILFIFYIGIKNINFTAKYFSISSNYISNNSHLKWLFSSILYASYNSIVLIPILINLSPYITTKTKAKTVSIICTIILLLLGTCIFCLLLRGENYISELELPIIQIIKEFGKIYQLIYGIVIVSAIFTSCISAGYSLLSNLKTYNKKHIILLCSASILISLVGFSKLVNIWYPFFGILGLIQIFYCIKKSYWKNVQKLI